MNCQRMSTRRAPNAFRMPISRVRSVTETSMMFMMPMPPTTSEIPAMLANSTVSVFDTSLAVATRSSWELIVKSFFVTPCRSRSSAAISSFAWANLLGLAHLHRDLVDVGLPLGIADVGNTRLHRRQRNDHQVVLVPVPPTLRPCGSITPITRKLKLK